MKIFFLYYPPFTKYRAHDMFCQRIVHCFSLRCINTFVLSCLFFFCFIIGFIVVYQTCFNRGCVVLIWFLVCVNINIMKGNTVKYILIDSWEHSDQGSCCKPLTNLLILLQPDLHQSVHLRHHLNINRYVIHCRR